MHASQTQIRHFFQRLPENIAFFRQEEVEELKNRLKYNNFLAVFGEEVHQVRSLIFEGLLPALHPHAVEAGADLPVSDTEGRAGFRWSVAPKVEPGANPLGNLAHALAQPGVLKKQVEADYAGKLEKMLRSGNSGLTDVFEYEKDPDEFNLVLVVDRLEEVALFKNNGAWHGQTGDDALFFNLILAAIRSTLPVYVILLMDAHSLNQLYQYSGFLEDIDQNRFTLRYSDPAYLEKILVRAAGDQMETNELNFIRETLAGDLKKGTQNGRRDPYALFKLQFLLRQARHAAESGKNADPLQLYKDLGKIKNSIDVFCEKTLNGTGVEGNSGASPEQALRVRKKVVERAFKALTEKSPTGVAVRRPVFLDELLDLCRRDVPAARGNTPENLSWGDPETKDLTERALLGYLTAFNAFGVRFIEIVEPPVGRDLERIVYIGEEAVVSNWTRIKKWVEQELVDAGIYKSLIEFARAYYATALSGSKTVGFPSTIEAPQKKTSWLSRLWTWIADYARMISGSVKKELKLLSKKIEFSLKEDFNPGEKLSLNAIRLPFEWKQNSFPNETWAKRYFKPHKIPIPDPANLPEDREALQELELNRYLIEEKGIETHFAMARAYYDLSLENVKGIVERREREKERRVLHSKRLTIIFFALSVFALISTVRACSQRKKAEVAQQNIQLFNFLDILSQTHTLRKELPPAYFKKLKEEIRSKRKITEEAELLDHLADSLYIPMRFFPKDNLHASLSKQALLTLNSLREAEDAVDAGVSLVRSAQSILDIAEEGIRLNRENPDTLFQFPHIYKALEEHILTLKKTMEERYQDTDHDAYMHREEALVTAFCSNPGIAEQYAFGDARGNIHIYTGPDGFKTLNPAERITAVAYKDSLTLYAATYLGKVIRYEGLNKDPRGRAPLPYKQITLFPALDQPIIGLFAREDLLLLCTSSEIRLMTRSTQIGQERYDMKQTIPLQTGLGEIRAFTVNPDGNQIAAGGNGRTKLFELTNNNGWAIRQVADIDHPDQACTALAISRPVPTPFGLHPLLAIGLEDGLIWLNSIEVILTNEQWRNFSAYLILHESSISSIGFNPGMYQMASSSLDGSIRLWNLDLLVESGINLPFFADYDHIRLEQSGQGFWGIVYINRDELFSTENITIRKWKTNIEALKKELEELLTEFEAQMTR